MLTVYTYANGGRRYRVEFGLGGCPARVMVEIRPRRGRPWLRGVWCRGTRLSATAAAAIRAARLEVWRPWPT